MVIKYMINMYVTEAHHLKYVEIPSKITIVFGLWLVNPRIFLRDFSVPPLSEILTPSVWVPPTAWTCSTPAAEALPPACTHRDVGRKLLGGSLH